ncbi:hypothetical protein Phi14:2_gp132 [Cellulophaga phage phi14:2]|uniref:Uncharacterized protein n=1 Tax=Cellulophaga phage phi14:2 TaxID=1327990 RepID=S0A2I2_9CAUD|nr:hypothetical protein Phi14:2_gp132 [Cellulophaga phage phi14:2]
MLKKLLIIYYRVCNKYRLDILFRMYNINIKTTKS